MKVLAESHRLGLPLPVNCLCNSLGLKPHPAGQLEPSLRNLYTALVNPYVHHSLYSQGQSPHPGYLEARHWMGVIRLNPSLSAQPMDKVNISSLICVPARSRVALKKKTLSMPQLELSVALTGAQIAKPIQAELTTPIWQTFLWLDSDYIAPMAKTRVMPLPGLCWHTLSGASNSH